VRQQNQLLTAYYTLKFIVLCHFCAIDLQQ